MTTPAAPAERVQLHAVVEGRVQGVGYRFFVDETARRLGVAGWVRNRFDRTVEVLAEGERGDLETLLAALRRGPAAARVADVRFEWLPASGEFTQFSVRSTQ